MHAKLNAILHSKEPPGYDLVHDVSQSPADRPRDFGSPRREGLQQLLEAIVSIIQSKIHLAESDKTTFEVMLKYIRHVSVYRAMRAANCFDKDPIALGEPFPTELLPLIEKVTAKLQLQYDSLLEPSGQSLPSEQSLRVELSPGQASKLS